MTCVPEFCLKMPSSERGADSVHGVAVGRDVGMVAV